jgi:enamine deaminase RidA (YjgF/YER057c/UK114 family)
MQTKTVLLPVLLASWLVGGVGVQEKQPNKGETKEMSNTGNFELLTPNTMPKAVGYSQVATVTGGMIVFVAGQVALDKSGNVVGKDDFRAQVQQVFENLKAAMGAAGGTFNDVIKLNSYFLDLSHLPEFREVRDKYVSLSNPPASTAVQVPKLFRPEFLVEIEAVAVVKNK